MSAPDRRALVDRGHGELSIRRQCELLGVARSGVYRPPPAANNDDDLPLMRRIDELFTAWPFLGSRRMTAMLRCGGPGQSQACAAADAQDGDCGARIEATDDQAGARTQDIPLSLVRSYDRAAEPSLVCAHHSTRSSTTASA
jgi:hypothetical protein